MAFAELNHIATNRPDRRRAIFADVDRKPSPWEHILNECLRAVNDVEIKLTELTSPCATTAASAPPTKSSAPAHNSPPPIPISQANILVKTGPRSPGRNLLDMVQAVDGSAYPSAALRKHLPIPDSFDAGKATKSALDLVKEQITPMLASSCGEPFRQTVQRVTAGAIPNVRVPINAVSGNSPPSSLLICSHRQADPCHSTWKTSHLLPRRRRLRRSPRPRWQDPPELLRHAGDTREVHRQPSIALDRYRGPRGGRKDHT